MEDRKGTPEPSFTPSGALGFLDSSMISSEMVRMFFVSALHPEGPTCPHCKQAILKDSRRKDFYSLERVRCQWCHRKFTARTGTPIEDLRIPERSLYLMLVLMALCADKRTIAQITDLSEETVRLWSKRFEAQP